jgi:hypothetical protein
MKISLPLPGMEPRSSSPYSCVLPDTSNSFAYLRIPYLVRAVGYGADSLES